MKIGAIIPAYNVGERLRHVLSKTAKYIPPYQIIVTDDGSTDNTARIADDFGANLVSHSTNRGKGAALKTGFAIAKSLKLDAVITLDGDGQHDPDRIPAFIQRFESTGADIILGKRPFQIGQMPLDRICSNRLSSLVVSIISGKHVTDSQCGYRLLRVTILSHLSLISDGYELESELLVRALRLRYSLDYCLIHAVYDGAESHIRRGRDMIRFCRLILRLFSEEKQLNIQGN